MKLMPLPAVIPALLALIACNSGFNPDKKDGGELISGGEGHPVIFYRNSEPNENAFTFLLPKDWSITGGITRVDPNAAGGAGNAIEAKL